MFRLQDNVPEIYIQLSRDFQLISRLFDTIFSGVKYDIDTVVNILDATKARDTILQLMCTKVGFFTNEYIDAEVLKYIIASFPYIIKYKGTKTGIEYAVNAILKAEHITEDFSAPIIDIVNTSNDVYKNDYTVYIYTTIEVYNRVALRELLRYVLPFGYNYVLRSYTSDKTYTFFDQDDDIVVYKVNTRSASVVRASDVPTVNSDPSKRNEYTSSVGFVEVIQHSKVDPPNELEEVLEEVLNTRDNT